MSGNRPNRESREKSCWPFLCVRELCRVALLMAASLGAASEPVATSAFPDPSYAYFGLARVVAWQGTPVSFIQLLEYHCQKASACSDRNLIIMDGDRLVTSGMEAGRVYAWFRGRGKYLRGWLPAANVKELPFDKHPTLKKWKGTWAVGDVRKIVIKADPSTGELTVTAHADWYGGRLKNGERVLHTGDVEGKALPDDNRLVVRDEDCVLELELVDEFLGAEDNMHCGGMNVSFSDVYMRDAREKRSQVSDYTGRFIQADNSDNAVPSGVSEFLCLSHTLDQEAEYGDQERDFG